jgi:hypothetical protein
MCVAIKLTGMYPQGLLNVVDIGAAVDLGALLVHVGRNGPNLGTRVPRLIASIDR